MPSVLRPRIDCVLILNGQRHEFSTTIKDLLELKRQNKGNLKSDMEGVVELMWVTCKRLQIFTGSYNEFVDAVDDFEADQEPPPLSVETSQDS